MPPMSLFSKCEQVFTTNEELKELYKKPDIVAGIRSRRIGWLGHVIRIEDGQMVQKLFKEDQEGEGDKGEPG
jgi:hypothetical protein